MFTISAHAQSQTLLKTAVLATIAVRSVNQTVPLAGARVHGVVLLAATEEALQAQKKQKPVSDLYIAYESVHEGIWVKLCFLSPLPCSPHR